MTLVPYVQLNYLQEGTLKKSYYGKWNTKIQTRNIILLLGTIYLNDKISEIRQKLKLSIYAHKKQKKM